MGCVCTGGELEGRNPVDDACPYGGTAGQGRHGARARRGRGERAGHMNEPYLAAYAAAPAGRGDSSNPTTLESQIRSDAELALSLSMEDQRRVSRSWRHRNRKLNHEVAQINNRIEERLEEEKAEKERSQRDHEAYEAELLEMQLNAKRLEEERKASAASAAAATATAAATTTGTGMTAEADSGDSSSTFYSIPDPDAPRDAGPLTPRSDGFGEDEEEEAACAQPAGCCGEGEGAGEEEEAPECSICLDNLNVARATFLPCMHGFHTICIKQWVSSSMRKQATLTCPTCMNDIPADVQAELRA